MRKAPKTNKLLVYSAAIALFIIIGVISWFFITLDSPPPSQDRHHLLSQDFYGEADPVIQNLKDYEARGASKSEIIPYIPESLELVVYMEDITSDDNHEHVVIRTQSEYPVPSEELVNDGFVGQVEGLIIYQNRGNELIPVFSLSPQTMLDEQGNEVLRQVPAEHGYAVLFSDFDEPDVYERTVKLINIVLVDSDGKPASDEIVVYWDPTPGKYKATNTFGAPGTFE